MCTMRQHVLLKVLGMRNVRSTRLLDCAFLHATQSC